MNRFEKKCVLASAGLHVLLIAILFVGPGFLSSKTTVPDMPVLDFVPVETVDELISGGGNPNAKPPPAPPNVRPQPVVEKAPPPPAPETKPDPKPEPKKAVEPDPQPDPEPVKNSEPSLEPAPKPRKRPEISLKQVVRNPGATESKRQKEAAQREAREYSEYRKSFSRAIASAANGIPGSISSGTTIEFKGPGGGGVPYANWLQAVKSDYTHAWELPDGVTDNDATVETTVTIARDGSVISAKLTRRSGNGAVDESIRATLLRVRQTAPLPKTATESQRTVTINFNVRAKKLLG